MRKILASLAASMVCCVLYAQPACPTVEVSVVADKTTPQKPLLTLGDFTDAKVSVTAGQIELGVNMTAESASRVQEFTANHVRTKITISLNGRLISMPTIVDPITGKGFQIGPLSREEAQKLADAINHKESGCGSQRKD
jgi:preprotein translocase subunit SecD